MKKLATVAAAVVMTAVSGLSFAGDLSDSSAARVNVSNFDSAPVKHHNGFKWGEVKPQVRIDINQKVREDRSNVKYNAVIASSKSTPENHETNGFRWGIRSHHETQGFRWGIR